MNTCSYLARDRHHLHAARPCGSGSYLIPWRKGGPEDFKTAWDLLVADQGGLVFQPPIGIIEGVAEVDFASMYPTIMAIHNLSAETVLCECCENHRVPESSYTVCEKREGMVPKVLRPLLARRTWLKRMAKEFGVKSSEFGDIEKTFGVKKGDREWCDCALNHVRFRAVMHPTWCMAE